VRGVPLYSILLAFVIGEASFLPFPSWQSLVGLVTSATAIMYGFAPVSLIALRRRDGLRARPYRLKGAAVLAPIGFISANLIIYWGGFDTTWRILVGLLIGLVLFVLTRLFSSNRSVITRADWMGVLWVPVWLIGTAVLGYLGRYDSGTYANGGGERNILPDWWDLGAVIAFSLIIFYWAVSLAVSSEEINELVSKDDADLAEAPGLAV
jgi:amino acid transporter